jgi:oligoribonuclease (3'-5' exoribonuclease)
MDPEENLKTQLLLAKAILESGETGVRNWGATAHRLAELVVALNEWIAKGGFLPKAWNKNALEAMAQKLTKQVEENAGLLRQVEESQDEARTARNRCLELERKIRDAQEALA